MVQELPSVHPTPRVLPHFLIGFIPFTVAHLVIPVLGLLAAANLLPLRDTSGLGYLFMAYLMFAVPVLLGLSAIIWLATTRSKPWIGRGALASNVIPAIIFLWVLGKFAR